MRFGMGAVFFALALAAQEPPAVRGVLLEIDQAANGQITVRSTDNYVHCFGFDSRTRIERDGRRQETGALAKGDTLEIVAEPGAGPRHARVVRILVSLPAAPKVPEPRNHWLYRRHYSPTFDDLFPRGDLTFSGIVSRVDAERLVLRTRRAGDATVVLRPDTRYMREGQEVAHSALRVNTRVFIRGTRNLDNDLEAYSVMWGDILKPD